MKKEIIFLRSAQVIFGITGVAKLISAAGDAKVLDSEDPLLGLPIRATLIVVALVELFVVLFISSKNIYWKKILTISMVSGNFLMYRAGFWMAGFREPCHCLGTVGQWMNISQESISNAMLWVALYLAGIGWGLFCFDWKRVRAERVV